MCGICGIWTVGPVDPHSVRSMNTALAHRGPDDEGYYVDDHVALGHRRLSIIDLKTGHQPISNEDDTLWIVFNGEIYNFLEIRADLEHKGHGFKTRTDTEVILHLYEEYGMDCVRQLQGMFAFAIWDARSHQLFLARDHVGQKPLFYYHRNGVFAFASEIKALLRTGHVTPELDSVGMNHLISLRFIPGSHSLFRGIHKLPAGHWMLVTPGTHHVQRYWDLSYSRKLVASEADIVEQLKRLLLDTVQSHLISDVPTGAFLSGGMDSSTVASMMAITSPNRISTFSIGVNEQDFNELPYARLVADKYHTLHHDRVVAANLIAALPRLIWHMDEIADPFAFGIYLVAELARSQVKVVLGGDGGDELFVGYDRYVGNALLDYYCFVPEIFRRHVIDRIVRRIPDSYTYNSLAQRLRWINTMSLKSGGSRYAESMTFLRFSHEMKQKLFTPALQSQLGEAFHSTPIILEHFDSRNAEDIVDKMLYTDMMTRMPEHLLLTVDHMTMAHGLEDRSPLLDHRVVEYAASIPSDIKLKGRRLKYIFKEVARDFLPGPLLTRRKQGFAFPLAYWMKGNVGELLARLFEDSRLVGAGYFCPSYMRELLEHHRAGKADHNYRLWILLNLELWWRIYIDGQKVEDLEEHIRDGMYVGEHPN